ncbi:glutaredoxin domain-containing protein [Mycobacteroides abscessus]|uniref:glutaredoxin domain-containing protein n=1 Tax=Mycobacteroides abscessus TaxID=36809 RepID=UPI000926B120|nr:glutaredoxin domain-containing protein [Mycobacteroides abscessus]MBN7329839.1 NrdH-redoxin [Mycobacteroides abscessus subsp. abscessus]SID95456.1 glutaredoxin electron transport component of NrdEF [Mycobacteroides abscessus subsp. abscessus]SIF36452.1 glutaredoxin electron transport component of NrdEF [Mycobacteroides abscessus subsp. abscessus]SIF71202.1 glutaredoxin electron transport component of NrdEF [Mycobacteroides abscessus subsp. abscessus]SIF94040.1 glutaredoxin electron transpor
MSVVVYTKSGCPQCTATRRALDRAVVPYRTVDVTADPSARDAVRALGYSALPVVVLPDGRHWSGFSPDRIAELANAKAA